MKKMSFDEFVTAVVEKIREYLPLSFLNADVELQPVLKNNDLRLTGLLIRCGDDNITPLIYLDQFYDDYDSGEDIGAVLEHIAEIRMRHDFGPSFDCSQITSFEKVKDLIIPRLIGSNYNANLLTERPHVDLDGLSATYHILLDQDENGISSIPVTNSLLDLWGIDIEALHKLSIRNMRSLLPATFQPISAVICNLLSASPDTDLGLDDEPMFVLSNQRKMYGASELLDPVLMEDIAGRLKKDFFVLPSSLHEVLLVPMTGDMDLSFLTSMVHSVNMTAVSPEDRLSDNVYTYTAKDGLMRAC